MASHPIASTAARHPIRARLAPRPDRVDQSAAGDGDLKLFVVSFTAFFVCFYTFFL